MRHLLTDIRTLPVIAILLTASLAAGQQQIPADPVAGTRPAETAPTAPPAVRLDPGTPTPPASRSGDAPVVIPDGYLVAAGGELDVPAENGVLVNDFDPEGDDLTAQSYYPPAHGELSLTVAGSFTYTPEAGFTGEDSFRYNISDGTGTSDFDTVTVTVLPADNRAPVAVDDHYAIASDETLTVAAEVGLLLNDLDPDGDAITALSYSAPANGSANLNTAGAFQYRPDPGFEGTDQVVYTITDDQVTASAAVVITVTPPSNRGPTPQTDWYYTPAETTLDIEAAAGVLRNDRDPDGDGIIAVSYFPPGNGSFSLTTNGAFDYTPDPGFEGTDVVEYSIRDDRGGNGTGAGELRLIVGVYGGLATGVITPPTPGGFALQAPSPNPFNPRTELAFRTEQAGHVTLRVLDLRGRVVATLVDEARPAGEHRVVWDGRGDGGQRAASGNYVAELRGGAKRAVQKLTLVK
jgi:hypothetical protein